MLDPLLLWTAIGTVVAAAGVLFLVWQHRAAAARLRAKCYVERAERALRFEIQNHGPVGTDAITARTLAHHVVVPIASPLELRSAHHAPGAGSAGRDIRAPLRPYERLELILPLDQEAIDGSWPVAFYLRLQVFSQAPAFRREWLFYLDLERAHVARVGALGYRRLRFLLVKWRDARFRRRALLEV